MGLPGLRGNGKFLAANLIDSLGNGAMLAFQVAFFVMTTDLSAIQIGGANTPGPKRNGGHPCVSRSWWSDAATGNFVNTP